MKSAKIDALAMALNKFQSEVKAVELDKENPFYHSRYSTLDSLWRTIREPLVKNGLSVVQTGSFMGTQFVLVTTLVHNYIHLTATF